VNGNCPDVCTRGEDQAGTFFEKCFKTPEKGLKIAEGITLNRGVPMNLFISEQISCIGAIEGYPKPLMLFPERLK
jgi:hypothetical protein